MPVSFQQVRWFPGVLAGCAIPALILGCAPAGGPVAVPAGKAVESIEVVAVEGTLLKVRAAP